MGSNPIFSAIIFRGIAQLVEQWSPKPRAEGSNPSAPAKNKDIGKSWCLCFLQKWLNPRHVERAGHRRSALPVAE